MTQFRDRETLISLLQYHIVSSSRHDFQSQLTIVKYTENDESILKQMDHVPSEIAGYIISISKFIKECVTLDPVGAVCFIRGQVQLVAIEYDDKIDLCANIDIYKLVDHMFRNQVVAYRDYCQAVDEEKHVEYYMKIGLGFMAASVVVFLFCCFVAPRIGVWSILLSALCSVCLFTIGAGFVSGKNDKKRPGKTLSESLKVLAMC